MAGARADSSVNVNITGNAKGLTKAVDKAEASMGGINKTALKLGAGLAIGFATDKVLDFAQTALKESDRVGDAATRLRGTLGKLADPLVEAADGFSDLGQSEGDMLDLEARIADIGIAAGITAEKLAPMVTDLAEVAAKAALVSDIPADEWISKIGKAAASGDMRALRDLGIFLDEAAVNARALADTGKPTVDALTGAEIAAARMALITAELEKRYGDATAAGGDFEQKQLAIGAKFETLMGKIGAGLEGPLNSLLEFILKGIEGWELLAQNTDEAAKAFGNATAIIKGMLGPIGLVHAGLIRPHRCPPGSSTIVELGAVRQWHSLR